MYLHSCFCRNYSRCAVLVARQSLVCVCQLLHQLLGAMSGFPLYVPVVGDWLRFRYPPARRRCFKHRFYDDFTNGRKVCSTESSVRLHAHLQCLEVRESWIRFHEIGREARIRWSYFIAVRFVNDDGLLLWTSFSRDDHAWLLPS